MDDYFSSSGMAGSDLWTIDHEDVTGGVGSISHGAAALPCPPLPSQPDRSEM